MVKYRRIGEDMEMLPEKDLLTAEEVAQYLGYTSRTIRNWIRDNELPAMKVGREYRIRRADLLKFLEERKLTTP